MNAYSFAAIGITACGIAHIVVGAVIARSEPQHGGILARFKQPCARQSRGRPRLVTDPTLSHEVDRRGTHLGLVSRRMALRENEAAWPTSALALRDGYSIEFKSLWRRTIDGRTCRLAPTLTL